MFQRITHCANRIFSSILVLALIAAILPAAAMPAAALAKNKPTGKGVLTASVSGGTSLDISGTGFPTKYTYEVRAKGQKTKWQKIGSVKPKGTGELEGSFSLPSGFSKSKSVHVCVKAQSAKYKVCTIAK